MKAAIYLRFIEAKNRLRFWNGEETVEISGYKHERFIFDLLLQAKNSCGIEVQREYEFAPLKNAEGADSPQTVHQLTNSMYRSWFEQAGLTVDPSIPLEVSPLFAQSSRQFVENWDSRVDKIEKAYYLEA